VTCTMLDTLTPKYVHCAVSTIGHCIPIILTCVLALSLSICIVDSFNGSPVPPSTYGVSALGNHCTCE
jgi:hypothetical protein